ncbi:MAG TPA: phosphotransferase [Candidatus Limnocylindrales bacterium]|nr:phosphotransferase [Candidatus Limnocylindrales bacterium]
MGPLARHASALGAVRQLLERYGLPGDRLETWKDGSNLLVRPVPVPVILRVATFTGRVRGNPMPYLEREVALVSWLADRAAPVMLPADAMPPGPFLVDGWGIAAFRFVAHHTGVVPGPVATLAALDELRAVLRRYPGPLPHYGPAAADLDLAFAYSIEAGILGRDRVATLRARRDALLARLQTLDPAEEPQHGDAFPRNAVVDDRDRVTWLDLEDACRGSRAWDLAVLVRSTHDPAIRAHAEERVGREILETALALREVQAEVWGVLHEARVARGW